MYLVKYLILKKKKKDLYSILEELIKNGSNDKRNSFFGVDINRNNSNW